MRSSGKRSRWALGLACVVALVAPAALSAQPAVGQTDPAADLFVFKSATATVDAGSDVTYMIAVDNSLGPDDAQNVTMTDPLPANTTFVALPNAGGFTCTTPAVGTNGTVSCTLATLVHNASPVITVVARINPATPAGTVITNTASVTSSTSDPNPNNNSASASTTVTATANLRAIKTDTPDPVAPGSNLSYAIQVQNSGPSNAANVTLTDAVPANTTFVSFTAPAGWTATTPPVGGTGTVTATNPSLGVSGAAFTLVVNVNPGAAPGTTISNTATAASATSELDPSNNSDTETTTVSASASADLSVTKMDSPDPVAAGANITYTITAGNAGPDAAGNATVTDAVPANTTFVSFTAPAGWSSTTPAVGGTGNVTATNPTFASGATATFTLVVKVNSNVAADATIANTASASSSTSDPNTGNNSGSVSTTVAAPPSISKAFGAASIPLNGTTSLTFTITNPNSGTALSGVGFSDSLPSGLLVATPNGLTNNCGGTAVAVAGSSSVSLSGATIAVNSSCTLVVDVTGTTAGDKNNTSGAVTSTEGGTGNTASASITVVAPPSISKAFGSASIPLNGSTSLSFTLTNPADNTVALTGVGFSDTLPAGLVVATPNGLSGSCGGGTITATDGSGTISLSGATLAAGASCTFAVDVTGTTAGVKNNTSGAVTSSNGGTGNTASASITVVAPPSISKAFGAGSILLNGSTSLSFTITNPADNTVALTGVGFSDTLPSGLVVATPNGLTGSCGGGTITAVAGSGTISLSGATLPAGGSCTFSANVTGTTAGVKNNTSGAVTSTEGGTGNTASASVTVGYNVLGFFSPLPKDSYKAGATIPVKFALADATGTRISDAEAQAIASSCRAQVRLDSGAPGCASYSAATDTFQFNLNTAKNTSKGTHTITLNVYVGGDVVSTKSTTMTIK